MISNLNGFACTYLHAIVPPGCLIFVILKTFWNHSCGPCLECLACYLPCLHRLLNRNFTYVKLAYFPGISNEYHKVNHSEVFIINRCLLLKHSTMNGFITFLLKFVVHISGSEAIFVELLNTVNGHCGLFSDFVNYIKWTRNHLGILADI